MSTAVQTYSDELLLALRMRDVPASQIAEALAEVHSHVADTGEDPRQAFGPPREYAKDLAAALGHSAPTPLWRLVLTWSTAAYGLGSAAGAWLLLDGMLASVSDDPAVLALPAAVPLLLGVVLLAAVGVAFFRLSRDSAPVLDPRTGADMTAPLPRWVIPVLAAPALLPFVLALVLAVAER